MPRENFPYIIFGFLICIALEYAVYDINHKYNIFTPLFNTTSSISNEKRSGGGNFTNPLLECVGLDGDDSYTQLNISTPLLQDFVDTTKNTYNLSTISVYVRDLNNGPWIGINPTDQFIGGSLLKVPMLISYLKLSESDPSVLKKVIKYEKQIASNIQYFTPSKQIEVGKSYTVDELLKYMIIYSDNNATEILSENIDKKEFDKVFIALGLGEPDPNKPYPVNTITYSSFFRVLFNASYLNKDSSEKALNLLSNVEFNKGIQSLIPKTLTVSHKFGIRTDNEVNQLHDCGIVYYPGHPYLLCIMSRGGTFDNMVKSISEISKFIYDQVSKNQ